MHVIISTLIKPIILSFLLVGVLACASESETKIIRMGHALNVEHPVHLGIVEMGRLLDSISRGQMTMKIYANGQLGSERELMELIQIGSLDITKVSAGALENFVPEFKVLTLPYLFVDSLHLNTVLNGPIGEELLEKAVKYRMKGLCFYDAGRRSFYSKEKPIMDPRDLSGLKVRVMNSQSAIDMVRALGGSPTPVSYGELYTALDQGIVDAAENNPPSFYTSRHYEICKYYALDEHTATPDVVLISTVTWNNLDEQEREWVKYAAEASVKLQKEVWAASVKESLAAVQAAGVEVVYPEKGPFQERVSVLFDAFRDSPEIYEIIERIQAENPRTP
jgi:tripartite ATP-independent transporter DctP family solute receptor